MILVYLFVFVAAGGWAGYTLKQEVGTLFTLSEIAGAIAFYNLIARHASSFVNVLLGVVGILLIAAEAAGVSEKYKDHPNKKKIVMAYVLSSFLGIFALLAVANFMWDRSERKK